LLQKEFEKIKDDNCSAEFLSLHLYRQLHKRKT